MARAPRWLPSTGNWLPPVFNLAGIYQPTGSVVHRTGAGVKLLALSLFSVVVVVGGSLFSSGPGTSSTTTTALLAFWGSCFAVLLLVMVIARLSPGRLLRPLLPIVLLALVIGGYQWWARGWQVALGVSASLLLLVGAGLVLTSVTALDDMIAVLVRLARPLQRFGLSPQLLALSIALVIRAVPELLTVAAQVNEAAAARGLERQWRAVLLPTAIAAIKRAYRTGEALTARGLVN